MVVAAIFGILFLESVQGMRVSRNKRVELVFAEGLDIVFSECLKQALLTCKTLRVTATLLFHAQDTIIHTERMEDTCQPTRRVFAAWMIGRVALHKPQHINRAANLRHDRHRHTGILRPIGPFALWL